MMLLKIYIVLLFVSYLNYKFLNDKKALRYRNWYRPWLVTILVFLAFYYAPHFETIISDYDANLVFGGSILYVIVFNLFWLIIKSLLHLFSVNDALEKFLKKRNVNKLKKIKKGFANHLLWPYFVDGFDIYYKAGYKFFKTIFISSLAFIVLAYFWTIYRFDTEDLFLIQSAYGLFGIIVLIEWVLYFNCTASLKPDYFGNDEDDNVHSNFYNLFKRYTNKEHGFYDSILFGFIKSRKSDYQKEESDIKKYIKSYIDDFKNNGKDFIVSSNDFLIAIPKFSEIFFDTLKKGGNVLLLADIPGHTKFNPKDVGILYENNDNQESIAKIFSEYLKQTIEYLIPTARNFMEIGYFDKVNRGGLSKRIVLSSVQDAIDDSLIHSNWMKELDLVVVIQFNDAYANNLLLKRKLSLWLDEQKIKYKTVLFKIFRTSGDEALTNTWMTIVNPAEAKIENLPTARQNYFLNFAFEKSPGNFTKIFKGRTHQYDFSPGIELSVFAVMENVKHVHYFEGYQLDYIQSRNKLATSQRSLLRFDDPDNMYDYGNKVTQAKINKTIVVNNLPFIVREFEKHPYCEDKHLSIIYDIENNAPKIYQKYRHLGKDESFVCIVSKPHLFREYFAEQLSYFVDVTLEAIEPQLSRAKINLCLQLFHLMKHEKIEIDYIRYLVNQHSIDMSGVSVIDFITDLFQRYLHLDLRSNSILKSHSSTVFINDKYFEKQSLSIDKQEFETNSIFDYLEDVKVVDNSRNILLNIPKYLIFQNILPQQNIIINGSSFQYNHYDSNTRELVLSAIATDTQTFYKPVAHLKFTDDITELIDNQKDLSFTVGQSSYRFYAPILEREVAISYTRYYKFEGAYHSPFSKTEKPQFIDLEGNIAFQKASKRKYITRYLKLHWELSSDFVDKKASITTGLHHLIYEFMPILFPYRHQYIQVASDNEMQKKHRSLVPWIFPEHNINIEKADRIEIYIIEDSFSDLGILKSIQTHLEYIFKNLYDLLLWIHDNKDCHTSDYMEFVKGQSFFNDRLQFLKYGLPKSDFSWDIELLLRFIKENAFFNSDKIDDNHLQRCNETRQAIEVECDYCKKTFKLSKVQIMEDGLHRCQACSVDAIDTLDQVKALEKEAFALYKKHLDLDINKQSLPYKLNFVTATALHQYYHKPFYVTNKYDKREAVGLASDRDIDVIHVEKSLSKAATLSIIVHEIMHVFQYQRLNYFKLKNKESLLVEGMTTWTEHYLLTESGVPEYVAYAKKYDETLQIDETMYGEGYRYVNNVYGDDKKAIEKIIRKYRG